MMVNGRALCHDGLRISVTGEHELLSRFHYSDLRF